MTPEERFLYHQIHPAKFAADICAAIATLWALWHGWLMTGIAVAVALPVAATLVVMRTADFERLKRSRFGTYVRKFMSQGAQMQRLAGFGTLAAAAWVHSYLLGVFGTALIFHAWTRGLLIPRDLRK